MAAQFYIRLAVDEAAADDVRISFKYVTIICWLILLQQFLELIWCYSVSEDVHLL
jgi:hypothetical protein